MNTWQEKVLELYKEGMSTVSIVNILVNSDVYDDLKGLSRKIVYDRVRRLIIAKNNSLSSEERDDITTAGTSNITTSYSSDGTYESDRLIEICEEDVLTPELLLMLHGLDEKDWKVVNYTNNYWHAQQKGGKRILMYQSKLRVRPYSNSELSPYWLKDWFDKFEPHPIELLKRKTPTKDTDDILILPIVDLHYNLLTTPFIEGSSYNVDIATERLKAVVVDVISRIENFKFSKIIFPLGNDLFNANGIKGTTFKGTQQYNDIPIREAYTKLFDVILDIIKTLSKLAPVDIVYIPSNHDKEITFYFVYNLYTLFRDSKEVTVDYSPIYRKFRKHGNTLMVFSHDLKKDKAGNIVIGKAGNLLAGVKYIEVFLAHLHHEEVMNLGNITVRRLPKVSEESAWSEEEGYGSNKVSQTFIVNYNNSVSDILYTRFN